VKWLGGVPVFVQGTRENRFKITAEQLQKACSSKTKAILMNNPCNPTGTVYSRSELEALAGVIVQNDIYCISDEVYEYFVYDGEFTSIGSIDGMQERTIIINGFSKSFCMTGWRVGYDASPLPIAKIIGKIQGQATHHPSNIAQYAAIGALDMGKGESLKMRETFRKRRDFMVQGIGESLQQEIAAPEGAFYLFAPVSTVFGKRKPNGTVVKDSLELCQYILESQGLAIVPGAAFGDDSCVRFSYAASDENLKQACIRFNKAIADLK
jgi:aspartate aminotransferase